jgi:hypothetical protein
MTVQVSFGGEPASNVLVRAVQWLRAGYPAGVPRQDYVVLLGLLRRKLTDTEVRQIAAELAAESGASPISAGDLERMVRDSVLQGASAEDVARVSARLAAGGWSLADPPSA